MAVAQQTFLGASITNFNVNMGWNDSASTLTVGLVVDDLNAYLPNGNVRTFNAFDEGYHSWDDSISSAPAFLGPLANGGSNGTYPRYDHAGNDNLGHKSYNRYDYFMMDNSVSPPVPTPRNRPIVPNAELLYHRGDFFAPPPVGSPVWFKFYDHIENAADARYKLRVPARVTGLQGVFLNGMLTAPTFQFNGLFTGFSRKMDVGSGELYDVTVEDPRKILESIQVILDVHKDRTAPPDGSWGNATEIYGDAKYSRQYKDGYGGYYNIINVFGYYENWHAALQRPHEDVTIKEQRSNFFTRAPSTSVGSYGAIMPGYGVSDINEAGIRWYDPKKPSILPALQHIMFGNEFGNADTNVPGIQFPYDPEEPFGGPIYYTPKPSAMPNAPKAGSPITAPKDKQSYRFKIDLSELYTLSQTFGGILPNYYRVKAVNVSLLQLIQDICNISSADFFVELLPDVAEANKYPANYPAHNAYSLDGIIKIRVRQRVTQPSLVALQQEIRNAETFDTHKWYGRMVSNNVGVEFGNEPGGKMVVGAPKTRVVGVSPLGGDDERNEYGACHICKNKNTGAVDAAALSKTECDTKGSSWEWLTDSSATTSSVCGGYWEALRTITPFDGVPGPLDAESHGECKYAGLGKCMDVGQDPAVEISAHKHDRAACSAAGYAFRSKKTGNANDKQACNTAGECRNSSDDRVSGFDNAKGNCEGAGHTFTSANWEQEYSFGYNERWREVGIFTETNKTYADAPDDSNEHGRFTWVGLSKEDWINDNWNAETREFRFGFEKEDCFECGNRRISTAGGTGGGGTNQDMYDDWLYGSNNAGTNFIPDMRVDIFPCWGFENRVILEDTGISTIGAGEDKVRAKLNNASLPIKGEFDSMYPERDFQKTTGLIEAFEWVKGNYAGGCQDPRLDTNNANLRDANCEGFNIEEVLGINQFDANGNPIGGKLDAYIADLNIQFRTAFESVAAGDPFLYDITVEDCISGWKKLPYIGPEDVEICHRRTRKTDSIGKPVRVSTADIKIDLRETGYSADGGFHYATVTELRKALAGFGVWRDFIKAHDVYFADQLGIGQLPTGASVQATLNKPIPPGGNNNQAATQAFTTPPRECDNESKVWQSGEIYHEKNKHVYDLIKNIASSFYGKQFLVPLPFDPQYIREHQKRTHIDDDSKIESFKEIDDWQIANAGWVEPIHKTIKDADQRDFKYPFDLTFYDNAGLLEPFMVFPLYHRTLLNNDTSIHTIEVSNAGGGYVSPPTVYIGRYMKIDVNGNAVPHGDSKGGRFAQARAVINEDGEVEKVILEHTGIGYTGIPTINFSSAPAGGATAQGHVSSLTSTVDVRIDLSEFDRNDYYTERERTDTVSKATPGKPAGSSNRNLTRVWIKASVDPKTYYLPSEILRPGRFKINSKGDEYEPNWEGTGPVDLEIMEQHQKLVPYALIQLSGSVRYGDDDPAYPTSKSFNAPTATDAALNKTINPSRGIGMDVAFFQKIEAARYKPWDAAIPQQATRESWGPWGAGRTYGRAEFEADSALSPENFGSKVLMGLVGRAKAWNDSVGYQSTESGSVNLVGLPEFPIGSALVAGGPYITNMSVDVGTGGVSTTYTMQTFRPNFGELSRYQRERVTRIHTASTSLAKQERDNIRFLKAPKTKRSS